MKLWKKIIFTALIASFVLFSSAYVFLVLRGKAIIIEKIEGLAHKKVTMGSFRIIPPLTLRIRDLNIENFAKVDDVSITPSIFGFVTGKIILDKVILANPEITYEKVPEKTGDSGIALAPVFNIKTIPIPKIKNFVIKHLDIRDGKINFIDRRVGENGIKITVKEINFVLSNTYIFPRSLVANFELSGRIPWEAGQDEGKIEAEGWLNLLKKDMQASLKVEDIDGVYLYPYYSAWVDLGKARIEKAKLSFFSNIHGLRNNIEAQCHLELTDIVRKPRAPEEPQEKEEKMTDALIDVFREMDQGKIVLDFTIRTKMDRPEFGFGSIKTAWEDKITKARTTAASHFKPQDILLFPGKLVETTIRSTTDISKAVIDGTFAIGKALKDGVESTLSKEKKEE